MARRDSAFAVILRRDHILVVKPRGQKKWALPGGGVKPQETPWIAALREVREETGLDVEPVALTGIYKNMTRGIVALVFRCKITGGDLQANDEAAAFRWAEAGDVAKLADEAYAVRVLDALDDDHPPAVRQHDGVHLL